MTVCDNNRGQQYALLSRLFVRESTATDLQDYLVLIRSLEGNISRDLMVLMEAIQNRLENQDGDISLSLRKEFARLFLLPGGVKPYESVYLGEEPLVMQQPWVEVKKFYQQAGWRLADGEGYIEDHVSVELAFMAHLIGCGANQDVQTRFFSTHLNSWMVQLLTDIADNAHAEFFRDVACYGTAFLKSERRTMGN